MYMNVTLRRKVNSDVELAPLAIQMLSSLWSAYKIRVTFYLECVYTAGNICESNT